MAQSDAAGTSFGELIETPVGDSLVWRGLGILEAAGALALAWRAPSIRRGAMAAAAAGALATIVVHVEAGHAAATSWPAAITVSAQVAHFAAAGVWLGGLAALLLGIRGAPPDEKSEAIHRFAAVAIAALVVLLITGTLRAVDELASPGDLFTTGYGRAVVAKVVLIALIVAMAARRRRRAELVLGAAALAAAALLGSLAPAVGAPPAPEPALSVPGSDAAGAVDVKLEVASDEPGPNAFTVEANDPDGGDPVSANRVELRFRALDDPKPVSSTLALNPGPDQSFTGSGPNLRFEGRWGVTVVVERETGTVEVPLELDLPIPPPRSVSTAALPGRPPEHTLQLGTGYIRISADPERAGPSTLMLEAFDAVVADPIPLEEVVVTVTDANGSTERERARRLDATRFAAGVELAPDQSTIGVFARTSRGMRLAGELKLEIPAE